LKNYEKTFKDPHEDQGQAPTGFPSEDANCRGQGYLKKASAKGKKTVEPLIMRISLAKARLWLLGVMVEGIRFYQRYISCLWPSSCRYHPHCSTYFIQSLNSYGIISGLFKGGGRILRCHPFSPGGYDPVNIRNKEKI